jgi:hypothetical protein
MVFNGDLMNVVGGGLQDKQVGATLIHDSLFAARGVSDAKSLMAGMPAQAGSVESARV